MFATRPRSTALPVRGHENPPVAPHNQAPHTSRCWQQCSRLFPPFFSSSNLSNPRYSWTVEERWVAGQNGHHPAPALADFVARGRGCFTTSATLPSAMDEAKAQMTTANITKLWEGTFKTFIINLHRRLLPPLCASVPSGGSCLQTLCCLIRACRRSSPVPAGSRDSVSQRIRPSGFMPTSVSGGYGGVTEQFTRVRQLRHRFPGGLFLTLSHALSPHRTRRGTRSVCPGVKRVSARALTGGRWECDGRRGLLAIRGLIAIPDSRLHAFTPSYVT